MGLDADLPFLLSKNIYDIYDGEEKRSTNRSERVVIHFGENYAQMMI